jgi:hypothetical protein
MARCLFARALKVCQDVRRDLGVAETNNMTLLIQLFFKKEAANCDQTIIKS